MQFFLYKNTRKYNKAAHIENQDALHLYQLWLLVSLQNNASNNYPSKHETSTQCLLNDRPASQTLAQH